MEMSDCDGEGSDTGSGLGAATTGSLPWIVDKSWARMCEMFPTMSFKDVYRCARECLGLKPNADSRSLRLTYIGNRLPRKECEWRYGEEIPCHDSLAYRRLQGVIMQAIIHK